MSEEIIIDVWPANGQGSLKANADVTLLAGANGELTIRCRVLETDSRLWVAYPQESYTKGSEKKYVQMVRPSKRLSALIAAKVLAQYQAAVATKM